MAKKKPRKSAAERLAEKRRKHKIQHEKWKALDSDKGIRDLLAGMQSQGWVIGERIAVLGRPRREYAILTAKHPQQDQTHVVKVDKRAYVACYETRRMAWSQLFDASYAFNKIGPGALEPPEPTDLFDDLFADLDADAGDD